MFKFEIKKILSIAGVILLLICILYEPVKNYHNNKTIRNFHSDWFEITTEKEKLIKEDMYSKVNTFNESIKSVKIHQANRFIEENISSFNNRKWSLYKRMYNEAIINEDDIEFSMSFETLLKSLNKDWYIPLLAILIIVNLFSKEYSSNIVSIVITTPRGRRVTAYTKLALGILIVLSVFTFFFISNIIIFEQYYMTNIGNQPIQTLDGFSDSPFQINYMQYILILFAYKVLILICITVLTAFITLYLRSSVLSTITSGMLVLIPVFFFNDSAIGYGITNRVLQFLPMSMFRVSWLFESFKVYNLFGFPVLISQFSLIYIIFLTCILLVLFDYAYVGVFAKPYKSLYFVSELEEVTNEIKHVLSKYFRKRLTLIGAEFKKFIAYKESIVSYCIIVIAVIFVVFIPAIKDYDPTFEKNYSLYIKKLEGKADGQKINKVYADINVAKEVEDITDKLRTGKLNLSEVEYKEYKEKYDEYANVYMAIYKTANKVFEYERAGALDKLHFFKDTGWDSFYHGLFDIFIISSIFISIAGAEYINREYKSYMRDIVVVCPISVKKVILNKLVSYGCVSTCLFLVISLVWYICISSAYGLTNSHFEISSILYFIKVNSNISILMYTILLLVLMCIFMFTVCQVEMFFSAIYRNSVITMILGSLFTGLYGFLFKYICNKSYTIIYFLLFLIADAVISLLCFFATERMFRYRRSA